MHASVLEQLGSGLSSKARSTCSWPRLPELEGPQCTQPPRSTRTSAQAARVLVGMGLSEVTVPSGSTRGGSYVSHKTCGRQGSGAEG